MFVQRCKLNQNHYFGHQALPYKKHHQSDKTRRFSSKIGYFIVVAAFALCPILMTTNNARAQCAVVGSIVTCGIDDNDGFASGVDITDLTIDEGVTVDDSGGEVAGTGIIDITGNVTGTFLNNGIINDAIGANDNAVDVSGTLNAFINNGSITSSNFNGVEAAIITSLINTGTITGDDDGVNADTITSLVNKGVINATDDNGIEADTITSLINSGMIIAGDDGVNANTIASLINSGSIIGRYDGVDADTITSLVNTGVINATDDNGVQSSTITSLINSGTIIAGDDGVNADTITSLINSGSIIGFYDGVDADTITSLVNTGIITGNYDNGVQSFTITSLINSGTIISGEAGVNASTLTTLINSGTIIGGDYGVVAGTLTSLTNSGKITGARAIWKNGAGDTLLTLLPGSDIFGVIDLDGTNNTLIVGNGLSIDHVFTAALPANINTNGAPFAVSGTRIVVVDTAQLAQQDEILFDLSQGIWGTVFNHIGDGRNPASSFSNSASFSHGPIPQFSLGAMPPSDTATENTNTHMWASVFGNHRIQNNGTPKTSARHNLSGLIAGLDGRVNSQWRLGAFFGAAETDIDTFGNQESDVESIFGGLYASFKTDNLIFDLGITGGATEGDNTRIVDNNRVNGLQTVTSDFDGTFIAPELSVSSQFDMGAAGILQPTLRVGYAGLFLDGYTEMGSTAPLTVDDRDLHLLHARFELAVLMSSKGEDSLSFKFSPYVGVEGRSLIDGEAVNATFLGSNLSFNPGGSDDVASAFAGMRFSVLKTENFGLFAGIEGSIDTEESSTITGNLGVKWRF